MGARGAFEFFATLQMSGPLEESAAKKSSDETPTAPEPDLSYAATLHQTAPAS